MGSDPGLLPHGIRSGNDGLVSVTSHLGHFDGRAAAASIVSYFRSVPGGVKVLTDISLTFRLMDIFVYGFGNYARFWVPQCESRSHAPMAPSGIRLQLSTASVATAPWHAFKSPSVTDPQCRAICFRSPITKSSYKNTVEVYR